MFAGGFQVNIQGQKSIGMAHCGVSLTGSPSSMFFNPGAFARLDSSHVYLGGSFIFANTWYKELEPGIYNTTTKKGIGTPVMLYASYQPASLPDFNFGIGVYTPFGSGIAYEDDWLGMAVLQEMSLRTIFIQPTVGYRINDRISVGAGYVFGTGNFLLRKAVPVQDSNEEYGQGELTGNATGHGFNVGVHFRATDALDIGLSYRSGVSVSTDEGEAKFTVPSSLSEYFPTTSFSTAIGLPSVMNFGISYTVAEKHLFAFDINYVGWSSYDTLAFDFAENTEKLDDINSPRMYNDAMIFRLGYQMTQSEKLQLRAGVYYDLTPVDDPYITPETPDTDKLGVTAGASYAPSSNFVIDISFLWAEGQIRTATNQETQFGGTWKSRAFIPGIGLQYIF